MILPVFAILVAPVLPVFAGGFEVVPALVAVLLEIAARLLAIVRPLVPGVVPIVDALLPLLVAVLRAFAPVRSLLRTRRVFPCARAFAEAGALCRKLRRAVAQRIAQRGSAGDASGDSEEIADIPLVRKLRGFAARAIRDARAGARFAGLLRRTTCGSRAGTIRCAWTIRATGFRRLLGRALLRCAIARTAGRLRRAIAGRKL
jgi:hypothetical protein